MLPRTKNDGVGQIPTIVSHKIIIVGKFKYQIRVERTHFTIKT